ncbi:hypothetical protein ACN42_g11448 [Penicillium freii]|uniref:Uncharacterized protein n=1 Tax=Penicillium freii TaxID=48697 RepID=A0A101M8C2_PENFR|nr:hypothetical protein ACN42_g11448 [Penicillium freii]
MHHACYDKLACLYCLVHNGPPSWAPMISMGPWFGPITHRWARGMGPKPSPFGGLGWVGLWALWAILRSKEETRIGGSIFTSFLAPNHLGFSLS